MLYRCSPSAFYNVVKKFSNEQKDAICSIGLGSLLQIHEKIHLRRHIIDFIVEHYSPRSGAVIVDNTTILISLTDMVLCFGLPVVGSQIVLEGNNESIRELCDHYQVKGGYIYKATLEKMLKVDDSEAIYRVNDRKVVNVGGFVLLLQYWYMEHVGPIQEGEKRLLRQQIPRFLSWTEEMFNLMEKYLSEPKELVLYLHPTIKEKQLKEVKRLLKRLPEDGVEDSVKEILPYDESTKLDERGNEDNEQPLLVISEGLPNLAFGVKDEHLHPWSKSQTCSALLVSMKLGVLKWRKNLHGGSCTIPRCSMLLRIFVRRLLHSPVKRGVIHSMVISSAQRLLFLRSDSKEMNMLGSTVAKRVTINSRVKRRTHKRKCYKSYADELPTHQRIKLRKAISALPRHPTRPSLFPSLTASQKAAVDDAQRCDGIHSKSDIMVRIDEVFVYRAAFKTLEPDGLLDDMVIDAYMRILDNQQRESGPPHQKRTYYGSSHLHQFMRKCVMERNFSSGVPVRRNSAGFDIYESDRVFIPINRSGVHWFLVEVDLLRRKVTILDSMIPRRTEQIVPEIRTLGDIEAYRDKIVVSLLLSPLNQVRMLIVRDSESIVVGDVFSFHSPHFNFKEEKDSSSWCLAWNCGLGAKVQLRKT
ncbi:hypothetical protein HHK36_013431 [Tetracentron sinense]|uniref:Ubiquitin-like protease family profile domain-containing protein n=1 Tax=Tetracentron sinense TaxID=13715 RepID=A0A834Z629_TETSI|nr:hypothetical protein HHK36_013431 [Tetracentron sinense]